MALPDKKIKKIKLPGDVDGSQTYEIIPERLQKNGYEAVLPNLTKNSTIALTDDLPSAAVEIEASQAELEGLFAVFADQALYASSTLASAPASITSDYIKIYVTVDSEKMYVATLGKYDLMSTDPSYMNVYCATYSSVDGNGHTDEFTFYYEAVSKSFNLIRSKDDNMVELSGTSGSIDNIATVLAMSLRGGVKHNGEFMNIVSATATTLTFESSSLENVNGTLKKGRLTVTLGASSATWAYEKTNVASIPTKTSDLTNDSDFITSNDLPTNHVTTDTAQTITGNKTFIGQTLRAKATESTSNYFYVKPDGNGYNAKIGFQSDNLMLSNSYVYSMKHFIPNGSSYDLGISSNKWRDLYLSGSLKDGTNSISVANIVAKQDALPTTTTAGQVLKSTSTAGTVEWGDASATGVTDVKVNNTSIVESGVATIQTNSTYNASTNKIATMSDVPSSFTISVTDDILNGTGGANSVKYAPYSSKGAGHLYTGTTNPSSTNRLNYDGYLYATKLYSGANEVLTSADKGTAAGNIPVLDSTGKLADSVIPAVAITDTYVVASETAMLELSAQKGDIAIRSDLNKSFVLQSTPASTLANWKELLTPTDAVLSVNGKTGAVTLTASDVGASTNSHTHSFTPSGSVTLTNTESSGIEFVESIASNVVTGTPITRYLHWSAGTTPKSGATPNHTSTNTSTATTITGLTTRYLTVSRETSGSGTNARRTLLFVPSSSSATTGAAMNMEYIESGTSSTHTHTYDKTTSVSLTAGTAPSLTANSTSASALATYLQSYSVSGGGATATTKHMNATFTGNSGVTSTPSGATGTPYVADSVAFVTTEPTVANTDGLKFVVTTTEPSQKLDGYYYIVKES